MTVCVHVQRVAGNGFGVGVRGVLHGQCGDCPGLLVSIPSLPLLDWSVFSPVEGFVIFRAPCLSAEGLPLVVRVGFWGGGDKDTLRFVFIPPVKTFNFINTYRYGYNLSHRSGPIWLF